jgi:hypothetical protein
MERAVEQSGKKPPDPYRPDCACAAGGRRETSVRSSFFEIKIMITDNSVR